MLKKIVISGLILTLSGCISIEAPDNLVSDTVEAGKDVYYSVKESMANDSSQNKTTFTYKYIVPNGELIGESSSKCVNHVVEEARKTLNMYSIDIKQTTMIPSTEKGQSVLKCSIVVGSRG